MAEDVIIVTSSLIKDWCIQLIPVVAVSKKLRLNISQKTMLQAIERYMKQVIVDKSPPVSSAALISSVHLFQSGPETIKRWVNEAQEALNSDRYFSNSSYYPLIL